MKIDRIIADADRPLFSFEFYPPKSDAGERVLGLALESLRQLDPDFVSVTYGAGGSTRTRTLELTKWIKQELGIEAMAHLSCVGATKDELRTILDDMSAAGIENVLALRGDPVSGTSLLATTIQASMLLRRTLDHDRSSTDAFGSRLFVFTDDLDVTNRLYFDLLDAEGRDSWGHPNPRGNGPLAALRSSTEPDHAARQVLGQAWDMCEAIGFHLDAKPLDLEHGPGHRSRPP